MYSIKHDLNNNDIESLQNISKILKCDNIVYDSRYIAPVIGVGPDRSYYQVTTFPIEINPTINLLNINVLDVKNLFKESKSSPAGSKFAVYSDIEYCSKIKDNMSIILGYEIDNNILIRDDNFHESNFYNMLLAGSASSGAFKIRIGDFDISIPKSAMPTLKSDSVSATVYNVEDEAFNILRFKIAKRNGIIVNQSMLFLPY